MIPDTLISLQHLIFAVSSSGDDRCPGADGRGSHGFRKGGLFTAIHDHNIRIIFVDRGHRIVYMLVLSILYKLCTCLLLTYSCVFMSVHKYLLNVEPLASRVHFTVLPFRNWKTPMCTIIGKFSLNIMEGTLRQAFSIRRFGRRSSHPLDSNIRSTQESNYHRSSKNSAWQGQGVPFSLKNQLLRASYIFCSIWSADVESKGVVQHNTAVFYEFLP